VRTIPYEYIDPEIRDLVRVLNETSCIVTTGSCIGHGTNPVAEIVFNVIDDEAWHSLLPCILAVNYHLDYANVEVYQWHRLSPDGEYLVDWILRVQVHPRNREVTCSEEERIRHYKEMAIESLILEIDKWQVGSATCGERSMSGSTYAPGAVVKSLPVSFF